MFCIVGYEETFQITANAHLNLLDDRKRAIAFTKYVFTRDFPVDLKIFLKESLLTVLSNPIVCAYFLLCLYFLVRSVQDSRRD
jgi:hypothetical protein